MLFNRFVWSVGNVSPCDGKEQERLVLPHSFGFYPEFVSFKRSRCPVIIIL